VVKVTYIQPARRFQATLIVALLLLGALPLFGTPTTATTTDDPIHIIDDADLVTQAADKGWPGSGTQADPYIIEGLTISAASTHGVIVHNTQSHLVLRNLSVTGNGAHFGVYLETVRNILVEDVHVSGVTIGFYVNLVATSTFRDNTATNTQYAFSIVTSNGNTFQGNQVTAQAFGFHMLFSRFNTIRENTISDSTTWGIFVNEGGTNLFRDNIINASAQDAIRIIGSKSNIVTGNHISGSNIGIRVLDANNEIEHNEIIQTSIGILIRQVNGVRLTENRIIGSPIGIDLFEATNALLERNTIRDGEIGINMFAAHQNRFDGDRLINQSVGILAFSALHNRFDDIVLLDNALGIHMRSARQNIYDGIHAVNNTQAIRLETSRTEIIQHGLFEENTYGITLAGGLLHEIRHTRFFDNEIGLRILNSRDNLIWDNMFENEQNVEVTGDVEQSWNKQRAPGKNIIGGGWIGGNWWHDYNGIDVDGDGLGEIPHGPFPYGQIGSSTLAERLDLAYGPHDQHPLVADIIQHDRF
jgi:parallel beta-helix repeat protein